MLAGGLRQVVRKVIGSRTGYCRGTRRWLGTFGLLVMGAGLSACGGQDSGASSSPTPSPSVQGTVVTAQLTESSIKLDRTTFPAGTYTFLVQERGQASHALSIEGPGVESESSEVLSPGDPDAALLVDLKAGTYTLWCPVGTHRSQGMEVTITVS